MAQQSPSRDAVQMLADDHRTVENLFEKYDNTRSASPQHRIVRRPNPAIPSSMPRSAC